MTRSAEEIYHQARQRPAGEPRAAYLDGACGQDVPLRAQVEALLQADSEASSFVRSAAEEDAGFDLNAKEDLREERFLAQPAATTTSRETLAMFWSAGHLTQRYNRC